MNQELQGHPQGSALQLPGWFGLGDVLRVHAHWNPSLLPLPLWAASSGRTDELLNPTLSMQLINVINCMCVHVCWGW